MAKVTVAIPTYNRPEYLAQTIRSILGQTFQDFEIFVFDDASHFSITDFLAQFNDARIRFLRSEVSLNGNAKNFQRIFRYQYTSAYLMVFHDDDTMHPSMLRREVELMEANPDMVLSGTGLRFIKDFSRMDEFFGRAECSDVMVTNAAGLTREILKGFDLCFGSVMYRTGSIEDIEPFQDKFSKWCDRPLVISIAKKGKVGIIRCPYVNYRIHPGQDSQNVVDLENQLYYSKVLFNFYREQLEPLTKSDRKLFYSFVTNNFLRFFARFSLSLGDFFSLLKKLQLDGYFSWRYLNARGLWNIFKGLTGIIRRN